MSWLIVLSQSSVVKQSNSIRSIISVYTGCTEYRQGGRGLGVGGGGGWRRGRAERCYCHIENKSSRSKTTLYTRLVIHSNTAKTAFQWTLQSSFTKSGTKSTKCLAISCQNIQNKYIAHNYGPQGDGGLIEKKKSSQVSLSMRTNKVKHNRGDTHTKLTVCVCVCVLPGCLATKQHAKSMPGTSPQSAWAI